MGVIPKPDGDVHLIHDCSCPVGMTVNDYCSVDWHQKFARVDDAAKLMLPVFFFFLQSRPALGIQVCKP